MNKFICIIFLLIFHLVSHSQELLNLKKANQITTILYLSKGDKLKYHVTNSSKSFKGEKEKLVEENEMQYDLEIIVTDSTENSYTYKMTYSGFNTSEKEKDIDKELLKIMNETEIIFKTDEFGVYDTILNLEELSNHFVKTVDLVFEYYLNKIKNEEEKTFFNLKKEMLKQSLLNLENVEINFSQDIFSIFSLYGIEMTLNKPVDFNVEYQILDNFSLDGIATLNLKTIDKYKKICTFDTKEKPDKESLNKFTDFLIKMYFPEFDSSEKRKNIPDIKFSSNISTSYTMDLTIGIMNKIKKTTTTKISDGKKRIKTVNVKEVKVV